ncbi:cytochrome P450 [Streptomyces sp. NBC_01481]|uniref:cytochrome P450 n=1 Tax=Streptomyces sp. NBC_01481 TaxID=2975869 RepID=UPI00224CAF54|nr:cytochrome P450 [Streptomyces sp. NBC_01481]MCX4585956.1 cytochrome P450 [Streptomyces sp. NBC_01481]
MPALPPGSAMPSPFQVIRLVRDPMRFFEGRRRRYGPVFRAPVFRIGWFSPPKEVFVATAELAERVYATDAGGGRAGETRRDFMAPAVGEHSLLSLDHEPWQRHRKLLTPPLRAKAIAGYRDEIARIAAQNISRWPMGQPFPLRDRMQEITLEVIMRLVFGITDTERLDRLRPLLPTLADPGSPYTLMLMPTAARDRALGSRLLRRIPFLPTTRFLAARDAVDELLYEEIARRRAEPQDNATDVLSRLLAARDDDSRPMTDQELRDELITMLEAGHETTATGLSWTFERLLRNPQVLDKLRAELDKGQETYLDAVVKEGLRTRPVVYSALRLLDAPLELGGYEVPTGWAVGPAIPLIHHDPVAFPEPYEFRPERFLGDGATAANKSWMPFGGGRRYCVGAQLALLEMRVIIRQIIDRMDLTAEDPQPERPQIRHVTLVPSRLTTVTAQPRATTTTGTENR